MSPTQTRTPADPAVRVTRHRRVAGPRRLAGAGVPSAHLPSAHLPSAHLPSAHLPSADPASAVPAGDGQPVLERRRRPRLPDAGLAAGLAAVLVACVFAALTTRQARADLTAGDSAVAAARTSAATILSYDYRHLDADFAAATARTTGSFRTDYRATTAKAVRQLATQTEAVVSAKVAAAGVVSSSADRATVLLFVNQTTTSTRLDSAKVDQVRVQMMLTRVGGRWLVSALKAL